MSTSPETGLAAPRSRLALWSGRILSGLLVIAMLMGAGMNLSGNAEAIQGAVDLGYPRESVFGIGVALLISTLLYAVPRTSMLGAILLTGYLGGAVATHIRAGQGWGSTIMAFVFGALVWIALLLRDPRLRRLLPLTKW
jgi:hypothetical protein